MFPLLPFYAERLGASPTQVGWLVGAYAFCQLFSGPVLGRLSDTIGRKPLLIVSQIGTMVGFLITAFASTLWVVFLGRMVDGATAGNLTIAQAYIADVTRPEERAKSFGMIGIAFGLGFLVGPAISGFLAAYDYRYPMFAAAFMSFTSVMATTFLLPSVRPAPRTSGASGSAGRRLSVVQWGEYFRYFKQPRLAPMLWQFLLFTFSFSLFISGYPLFCERRLSWHGQPFGPEQTGYSWAYVGFLGIFLQGPAMGRLVRHFGERTLNLAGFAAYAAGYGLLALTHSVPMLILTSTVLVLGGLVRPTLTSLISQSAPREEQGVIMGLTQSLTSISQIAAPPLGGLLIEHNLLTAWGILAAAITLGGLVLAARSLHSRSVEPVRIDT